MDLEGGSCSHPHGEVMRSGIRLWLREGTERGLCPQILQRKSTGLEKQLNNCSLARVMSIDYSLLCAWQCFKGHG